MHDSARRKLLEYEKLQEQWRVTAEAAEQAEVSILRDELAGIPIDAQRRIGAATLAADARRLLDAALRARPEAA